MEIWHIWVIVALVLVVVEIFTQGFAVLCLAFGAGLPLLPPHVLRECRGS